MSHKKHFRSMWPYSNYRPSSSCVMSAQTMSWSTERDYSDPSMAAPVTGSPGLNLSPYALDPSYLPKGPEFIFPVEMKRKSWNEQMFHRTGTCYMSGLVGGGMWGLYEGLQRPEGRTVRLRMNSVLNGLTRRGPFLGNTLAVLALMYSPLESVIGHYRGEEDSLNSIAAATITGLLYKSTGGVRAMGLAGGVGCATLGLYTVGKYMLGERGRGTLFYS